MNNTNRKNSAVKLGLAAASALALTLGGVSSAYAADINIGPDDVAGFEVGDRGAELGFTYNYDQWHVGLNVEDFGERETSESLTFGECSVTTLAHPNAANGSHTQVLKGFPVEARPSTADDIKAVFNSTSITILEGDVTIQFPMFVYDLLDDEPVAEFTTVRTEALAAGTYSLADLSFVDSNGWLGGSLTLGEFFEWLDGNIADDYAFELLGVGFTGSEGAVVETLSFSGDTYYFGTGDCAPAASTPNPSAPTPPKEVQTAAA